MNLIKLLLGWLSGGALDRVLDTVDKRIQVEADKEKIKADLITSYYSQRTSFMQAGGFWLMFIFAFPLAIWWTSVLIYSILWCARCAYPQTWSIAALPSPLNEWAGAIIIAIFGVIGVTKLRS